MWSCFSSKGPENFVRIHTVIDSVKYQESLNKNLAASAKKLQLGCGWKFHQDNGPVQTSKSTQKWFSERLKLLTWLSQSPDQTPLKSCELT